MFIRVFQARERKELLVNVNLIQKIEVEYAVRGDDGQFYTTSVEQGMKDPTAQRLYRVFVAGETLLFQANPNEPVMKVFDEIYKSAIKG